MASVALGILNAVLEQAVKFANERSLYGKPISNLQAIQWHIAEIYADLEISRLLVYRVGWMRDNNIRCDIESAMAKQFACEAAAAIGSKSDRSSRLLWHHERVSSPEIAKRCSGYHPSRRNRGDCQACHGPARFRYV